MIEEPTISKELRALMDKNLTHYPHGMICTGVLAITKPHNTIHTTFGGFQSQEDLTSSLSSEDSINSFMNLTNLFSKKEIILYMNKLITDGPQNNPNKNFVEDLKKIGLVESHKDLISITGKGRIFVLSVYSLIS